MKNIVPAIEISSSINLKGVYSRNLERARKVAFDTDCIHYRSSSEMLSDPEVDAIYISSPNGLHYEQVIASVASGKHVLVEKTAFCSVSEAESAVKKADEMGVFIVEAFMYRHHPQFERLSHLIKSRKFGELQHLEVDFGFPHLDEGNIRYQKDLGGGALNDAGAYTVAIAQDLLGANSKLNYALLKFDESRGVDTSGLCVLSNGISTANCNWGFGLGYRNEIMAWTNQCIIESKRIFSKPSTLQTEIIVKENQKIVHRETIAPHNHFVSMFYSFSQLMQKRQVHCHKLLLSNQQMMQEIRSF